MNDNTLLFEKIELIDKKLDGLQTGFPAWFDVRQCANYLSVSPSQIRKLIASGSIPFRRVGGCLRFNRKMVDLWVLSGELKPNRRTADKFGMIL